MHSLLSIKLSAIALSSLFLSACSHSDSSTNDGLGTLELDLSARAQGNEYRLRDAVFELNGGRLDAGVSENLLRSEDNPQDSTLRVRLAEGNYTLRLLDGWRMENASTAPPETVPAILFNRNVRYFSIRRSRTSRLDYRFGVEGTELDFGGDLEVRIHVEVPPTPDAGVSEHGGGQW